MSHSLIDLLVRIIGSDRAPSIADIIQIDPLAFDRSVSEAEAAAILNMTPQSLQVCRSRKSGPAYTETGPNPNGPPARVLRHPRCAGMASLAARQSCSPRAAEEGEAMTTVLVPPAVSRPFAE
jgi:hypothetical protein